MGGRRRLISWSGRRQGEGSRDAAFLSRFVSTDQAFRATTSCAMQVVATLPSMDTAVVTDGHAQLYKLSGKSPHFGSPGLVFKSPRFLLEINTEFSIL